MSIRHLNLFPVATGWLDESAGLLASALERWGEEQLIAKRPTLDEQFDELLWPAAVSALDELGLRELTADETADDEPDPRAGTLAVALEQIAVADVGIAALLAGHTAATRALWSPAPPASIAEREAPPLAAVVLPGYGPASAVFDGLSVPARARLQGDRIILESDRPLRPTFGGAEAELLVVACELRDDAGPRLALVALEASTAGVKQSEPITKTGLAVCRAVELELDRVELPADQLIGQGRLALDRLEAWLNLGVAAAAQGAMIAAHRILREWGETRVIKGKGQVFKDNALVASQMGRVGLRVGTSRLQLYGLAQLMSARAVDAALATTAIEVALATLDAAMSSLDWTMELMASAGYAVEWQLERPWRDVKTLQTCVGPAPAALTRIAGALFGSEVRAS